MDIQISLVPKSFATFFRVIKFCEKHLQGLDYYSEQTMESLRADLKLHGQNTNYIVNIQIIKTQSIKSGA